MNLTTLDWSIVVLSLGLCFIPAVVMAKRAGQSSLEFFTSGRAAPWWLIGVSMVATTFSTDTPNLVTDLVRSGGVANNWQWWAFLLTGMMTVFFFARLWRRSGVMTDLEFYELRYSGKAASLVRGFRAIYLGLFFNCFIMATVNLAAAKIANVILGWPMGQTLLVCFAINVVFAATGGLWGVMLVDLIQFGIAMTGAVAVAYFALKQPEVGGLAGMMDRLPAETTAFLPDFGNWGVALSIFVIPLTVQWWSVWYPGAEPGGGSYVAQRMLAARSERDAMAGTLFFNAAHYALRSWPWILVALASILVFPDLESIRQAFPHVDPNLVGNDMAYPAMLKFLPSGFLGIMVAGMLAAYVSTIVTHLNWGASYLVHDFWRRFIRPDADERHYVMMGRLMTVVLMSIAAGLTFVLDTASQAFQLLLSIGAGTGLLYLLRWFWWRISAWCEIVAMTTSFVVALSFFIAQKQGAELESYVVLLGTVAITSVAWLLAAFFGPRESEETLISFYRKIRPAGPGWKRIRAATGLGPSPDSLPQAFLAWTLGCLAVYGALFGTGSWLYGHTSLAIFWTVVTVICTAWLIRLIPRLWGGVTTG